MVVAGDAPFAPGKAPGFGERAARDVECSVGLLVELLCAMEEAEESRLDGDGLLRCAAIQADNFAVVAIDSHLRFERFDQVEMWERLGFDLKEVMPMLAASDGQIRYRKRLFSRIVPIVKDIGLWGDKVQKAFRDMGVLDMAGLDIEALMKADEDQAAALDKAHAEMADRALEVDEVITAGAS